MCKSTNESHKYVQDFMFACHAEIYNLFNKT